ncbi:MAG: efflux RND transporter permease subunit [Gammaproteobacteria bacterium]|nr:efflux RND transporter permease subunit [Gammaproteobacteria bacterium]
MARPLGISGRIAALFLRSEITPLLALAALLLGVFAVLVTPREEEPQINVTFANIIIGFPGASAAQVENLVASPMEKVLGEIAGVKHIHSVSQPGVAVLSIQFEVGEERTDAIVRLYNAIYSNQDWQPPGAGVLPPLIKPKGIDDVPVLTLTLWTRDPARGGFELSQVARSIETELKRVPGTRDVYTIGSPDSVVRVDLDPHKLSRIGLAVDELAAALTAAGQAAQAGVLVDAGQLSPVQAGSFLASSAEVAALVVALRDGRPVYLGEVATVSRGADPPQSLAWHGTGAATPAAQQVGHAPAVTLAIAKKPGENAIDVTRAVLERVQMLRGTWIPEGVEITETRNYGLTANDKAQKLIQKLLFATLSVVVLVLVTMGRREALVVGAAVIVTLAATLFASWAWGFTINRVSLFALIFSIGILVDDAIVIVENIHRRQQLDGGNFLAMIPAAVDEVGGPTILATFTVIAALLPMAFVSGLMGPYMSPIPINASMGMLISLVVALVFTPWLSGHLLAAARNKAGTHAPGQDRLRSLFERVMLPFLDAGRGRARRHLLYAGLVVAIGIAAGLAVVQLVVLKMLPFDNKSEFQVILDMPEGTPVETTARVLDELSRVIAAVPEVRDYQAYAGTAAPINFNGLVRQYYLRASPELGDLQVNLVDKHQRRRASHAIALAVRPALAEIGRRHGASVQVVEVPPGPPVQAPIVAEVYGPFHAARREAARELRALFEQTADIIDVDDSTEAPAERLIVSVDRQKAALLGVPQAAVVRALGMALGDHDAAYVHEGAERHPIPVRMGLGLADKARLDAALELGVRAQGGALVPLSALTRVEKAAWDGAIHHKDLLPVVFVTGDMAGRLDSPLYGMFDLVGQLGKGLPSGLKPEQRFIRAPEDPNRLSIKWDGEWQITYETFRDMGLAYSVGLVLIYLLIVAHFHSYFMPLVIMAPIPLTIIGVMPGHALMGAQFTATSMIGMIALAGIIVRNSILLVDFIDAELARGEPLAQAVVDAAVIRARPIALTALAAVSGAFFILDDPIFNGLAVSLIFGVLVSTLLTLVVIPVLYFAWRSRQPARPAAEAA